MLAVYRHWRILPPASTLWRSAIVGMLASMGSPYCSRARVEAFL
jgi:hypothetical protein